MRTIEIPKMHQPLYQALDSVKAKNSGRVFIEVIYWDAKNKALVSTNGRSILVCRYKDLENKFGDTDGYFIYNKPFMIETTLPKTMSFPQWQRVVPNYNSAMRDEIYKPKKAQGTYMKKGIAKKYAPYFMMNVVTYGTGKIFDPELFDMIKGIDESFVNMYHHEGLDPVILTDLSDTLQYVIMPFSIKGNG